MTSRDVASLYVAGLTQINPAPWVPIAGQAFEARLRGHGDTWYKMTWCGWSVVDPGRALVECLVTGPRHGDVIVEMRP